MSGRINTLIDLIMEKEIGEKKIISDQMGRRGGRGFLFLIVVVVVVLVGLWWFGKLPVGPESVSSKYQAVFLSNNQVYFGKLTKVNSEYPVLKDVFYLQVTQPLQPAEQGASAAGQNISLIKLGGELHGPEDTMIINREHIIFYEDLTDDSQIVQKIVEFKNGQQ